MSSIDNMGSLLSAAGVGALLSKGLDWVLERRRKRDTTDEARTAAEVTDRATMSAELWRWLQAQEQDKKELRRELDRFISMNAEVTSQLLSVQAEVEALQKQNEALQKQNEIQQREIEALQRALGKAALTETGQHPTVT